jgi:hypothetical protein
LHNLLQDETTQHRWKWLEDGEDKELHNTTPVQ